MRFKDGSSLLQRKKINGRKREEREKRKKIDFFLPFSEWVQEMRDGWDWLV